MISTLRSFVFRRNQALAARAAISYITSERPSTALKKLTNKRPASSAAAEAALAHDDVEAEDLSVSQPGFALMRTPITNKGQAFSEEERTAFKLRGLLPVAITSIELETERAMMQLRRKTSPIEKYIFLQNMQDTNEDVYYRMLIEHTPELMPIVYTPTVGQACQEFSHIYRQTPRGLYISINDIGHVAEILDNWPEKDIRAICFTDGERILGLGDQGANGMGIPVGKLSLYTACAGVPPQMCLPVVLDCGTNNEEYLADPFYIGLRQKRVRGEKFEQLVDEFMNAAKAKYGDKVLLQFEDFGNSTAFQLLRKYQNTHCTFNDDIQGTASVVLAGLLAAVPLSGKPISEQKFVFLGAGTAGTGIADLIAMAISRETGKTVEESRKQIWLVDSRGLVVESRKDSLQSHKLPYAHDAPASPNLVETLDRIKPTALIGVCTIAKAFNEEVCQKMCEINERPIIFALSNPTSKAECTAEEAYTFTDGKCIFASGSPFDPLEINGKLCVPGQGNNSYIFPGVGLGVVAAGLAHVNDDIMIIAAKTLASLTTPADLETGCVYPPLSNIREVSLKIAEAVAEYGYEQGFATVPKPEDLTQYLRDFMYNP
ncbi:NADP-dependent malic enzyme, chloroplastic [Phytophthora ramorum]|uniref:NADP-dependent malic enzyme, chloroplastic n=1 Tax=Phytophthora ramorum TaxID=164328 RepID=UPI0030A3B7DA|nr:NADP-dependent malic enzyme, chloroplastic [Phytophthora ramorum]